jgi:uncharacterized repeat protein (TIGR02543 family)
MSYRIFIFLFVYFLTESFSALAGNNLELNDSASVAQYASLKDESQILKEKEATLYTQGFGRAISIYNGEAIIASNLGVYFYKKTDQMWVLSQKAVAFTNSCGGKASISGNYAVYSCPDQNKVYVFKKVSDQWAQAQIITPTNSASYDRFGASVDIYGNNLIIGAPGSDPDDGKGGKYVDAGKVYIYKLNIQWDLVGSWSYPRDRAGFGAAVAIYDDEAVAVVNSPEVVASAAIALTFKYNDSSWNYFSSLPRPSKYFTSDPGSVSADIDNMRVVLGDGSNNVVTIWDSTASGWGSPNELRASDSGDLQVDDFGATVQLQGNNLLIGAPRSNFNGIGYAGSAYVFRYFSGGWLELDKLISSDRENGNMFGSSIALDDGDNILIGAPLATSTGTYFQNGQVYSYVNTPDYSVAKLVISNDVNGLVASQPSGIYCGFLCAYSFSINTQVTLSATPSSGYVFAGWTGDCLGLKDCSIIINKNHNVTARFYQGFDASQNLTGSVYARSTPTAYINVPFTNSNQVNTSVYIVGAGKSIQIQYPNYFNDTTPQFHELVGSIKVQGNSYDYIATSYYAMVKLTHKTNGQTIEFQVTRPAGGRNNSGVTVEFLDGAIAFTSHLTPPLPEFKNGRWTMWITKGGIGTEYWGTVPAIQTLPDSPVDLVRVQETGALNAAVNSRNVVNW